MSKVYTADPKRLMQVVLGPDMLDEDGVRRVSEAVYDLAIWHADDPGVARERIRKAIEAMVLVEHARALSAIMSEGEIVTGDHR